MGANWKSEKGYKLGLFYLKDRANSINKEEFDFIAVIDPEAMQKEFISARSEVDEKSIGNAEADLTIKTTLLYG